jgi:alpha-L-rhamnosidase
MNFLSFLRTQKICIYILFCTLFACNEQPEINVENLRCELLTHPQGIDLPHPRLSWEIRSEGRDVRQTAYQILVASSPEKLVAGEGDLWDSGQVSSDESVFVPYGGQALESRMVCYWKVKVFTNRGTSQWSQPAQWSVALLQDSD